MTTLEAAQQFGPAVLSVVGSILTVLVSILGFLFRQVWKAHMTRMNHLTHAIQTLAKQMTAHEQSTKDRIGDFESAIQGLRAELYLSAQKFEHIRSSLLGCETNIKSQQSTIVEHIRELAKIDSKLDAIFRFIDARPRATDVSR